MVVINCIEDAPYRSWDVECRVTRMKTVKDSSKKKVRIFIDHHSSLSKQYTVENIIRNDHQLLSNNPGVSSVTHRFRVLCWVEQAMLSETYHNSWDLGCQLANRPPISSPERCFLGTFEYFRPYELCTTSSSTSLMERPRIVGKQYSVKRLKIKTFTWNNFAEIFPISPHQTMMLMRDGYLVDFSERAQPLLLQTSVNSIIRFIERFRYGESFFLGKQNYFVSVVRVPPE